MKNFFLIMFFLICLATLQAADATIYVATTGNDTTGDGTELLPYATIGKAYSVLAGAGNFILVDEGTYTGAYGATGFLEFGTDSVGFTLQPKDTGETVTLATTGANEAIYISTVAAAKIVIDGLTITPAENVLRCIRSYNTTKTGLELTIKNCTMTLDSSVSGEAIYIQHLNPDDAKIHIIGNTITCDTHGIRAPYGIGANGGCLDIRNNIVTVNTALATRIALLLGYDQGYNENKTGNGEILIENNVFRHTGSVVSHTVLLGAGLSHVYFTGNCVYGGNIQLVIKTGNNVITDNVIYGSEPLLIKGGKSNFIEGNTLVTTSSGAIGFNTQATNCRTTTNRWLASTGDADAYYLDQDTGGNFGLEVPDVVNIGGAAATKGVIGSLANGQWGWGDIDNLGYQNLYVQLAAGDPDGQASNYIEAVCQPRNNYIKNNICSNPAGTGYTVNFYAGTEPWDNYLDHNCYYTGGAATTFAQGAGVAKTAAQMLTWLQDNTTTESTFGPWIDDNSLIQVDPDFDSNYQGRSQALNQAGTPLLLKSDGTVILRNDIGATQVDPGGGSRSSGGSRGGG